MGLILFALYVAVEVAAVVAVGQAIGALWTVALLIAGSAIGMLLVGSQYRRVMIGLRAAAHGERSPDGAVADGVLVALGAALMFVPGLVTSLVGLLLLLPPTRFIVRPLVVRIAARRFAKAAEAARTRSGLIDGEVVGQWYESDVRPVGPLVLEHRTVVARDTDTGWGTTAR